MGDHQVHKISNQEKRIKYITNLLDDLKALEQMLAQNLIEDNIVRIGAEQEFCLVTSNFRPSNQAEKILAKIDDPHFTTELAKYNLEINLDPIKLESDCFSKMQQQLSKLLERAKLVADNFDNKVILCGILPTISKSELTYEFMASNPRYSALDQAIKEARNNDFELHIRGVDELSIIHDSVLFEACNTSFQMHLQIKPDDFIASYNWAQAISGPLLSICANAPLLLGRELWQETRIALFQQSIDTRTSSYALKDQQARVTFGKNWAKGSIADIFKHDIAQYETIVTKEVTVNSLKELSNGSIPKLEALNLFNGSVYRWNRACYGVGNGKPHLRIENRYIPSGPSVLDEMANLALWVGMMIGRPEKFDNIASVMNFNDVKSNFIKSARTGKESILFWDGNYFPARDLMLNEFLPMAYRGLSKIGVNEKDITLYLNIIEKRCHGKIGSTWQLDNYRSLRKKVKKDDALVELTKATYENQQKEIPIHEWEQIDLEKTADNHSSTVGHIMSTQLFTVLENDLANLAIGIMEWKNIHHVPVKNKQGLLCGLLTRQHVRDYRKSSSKDISNLTVEEIMVKDVIKVKTKHSIESAIDLMKTNDIGCLPIVDENQLVGIVTKVDLEKWNHD